MFITEGYFLLHVCVDKGPNESIVGSSEFPTISCRAFCARPFEKKPNLKCISTTLPTMASPVRRILLTDTRMYLAAICFGIGAATEAYTGTKTTKHYDANEKLVKKEKEYHGARATGIGWGLIAAAVILGG